MDIRNYDFVHGLSPAGRKILEHVRKEDTNGRPCCLILKDRQSISDFLNCSHVKKTFVDHGCVAVLFGRYIHWDRTSTSCIAISDRDFTSLADFTARSADRDVQGWIDAEEETAFLIRALNAEKNEESNTNVWTHEKDWFAYKHHDKRNQNKGAPRCTILSNQHGADLQCFEALNRTSNLINENDRPMHVFITCISDLSFSDHLKRVCFDYTCIDNDKTGYQTILRTLTDSRKYEIL